MVERLAPVGFVAAVLAVILLVVGVFFWGYEAAHEARKANCARQGMVYKWMPETWEYDGPYTYRYPAGSRCVKVEVTE